LNKAAADSCVAKWGVYAILNLSPFLLRAAAAPAMATGLPPFAAALAELLSGANPLAGE
jgi:hypothetical protein